MEKVIDELRVYENQTFPKDAVNEAIANKEETTEILLKEFDEFLSQPEIILNDSDYVLHIYALYLLSQFRVKEAFPKIIEFASWPEETIDFTMGDIVTEDLSSMLYSIFNGDFNRLKKVVENPAIAFYIRDAALNTYTQLYADGHVPKEEFFAYLRKLLANKRLMVRQDISETIQGIVMEYHLFEMLDDIQALYDEDRMDTQLAGEYDEFLDFVYKYEYNEQSVTIIEDTIREMEGWAMFEPSEELERENEERQARLEKEWMKLEEQQNPAEKVGRNDPCPCGSGKKYKKCCLKKDNIFRQKKQEPLAVQRRWLEYYPKVEGERQPGEVRITDHFDEKAIEIDRLVYLALRHRSTPIWEKKDEEKEITTKISYLKDALELFLMKCEKEDIQSFEAYDNLHKIHYRSKDWVTELNKIIVRNYLEIEHHELLEQTKEIMRAYSL